MQPAGSEKKVKTQSAKRKIANGWRRPLPFGVCDVPQGHSSGKALGHLPLELPGVMIVYAVM